MQIKKRLMTEIKPYWRNSRNHKKTLAALKTSIKKYGFNQPLVIDAEGVIIVGHARYHALKELNYTEAPCVVAEMSKQDSKAYRIADNKIHELTDWNTADLLLEIRETGIEDLEVFFPDVNLDSWISESIGVTVRPVTDQQVERQQAKMETKWQEERPMAPDPASHQSPAPNSEQVPTHGPVFSREQAKTQVELICPHCSEMFFVNRKQL